MARTLDEKTYGRTRSRKKPAKTINPGAMLTLALQFTVFAGLCLAALLLFLVIFLPLPEPKVPQATEILDINGRLISSVFVENRKIVPSAEIPKVLKDAVVAVEDKRFYIHRGIDLESIFRALIHNLEARRVVEGGSTITQQLAKNLFLTQETSLKRKIIEAVYTMKLEMRYTKDEILTMYLNQIYFGHGTYGCEVASRTYFGKGVKELTLSEAATLAGIIRSPENYSPYNDMQACLQRRSTVLDLMVEQGYISDSQRQKALAEPLRLAGLPEDMAPYFVNYVVSEIRSINPNVARDIARGGYRVFTTLDIDMQRAAEEAFALHMPQASTDSGGISQPQGALVAIAPETGYIKALIGGRDWNETQLNRAFQIRRQPGSAFKMVLYTAVIDMGYPVTSTQVCEPVRYPGVAKGEYYSPVDYGSRPYHYAPLDIRQAVAISDNVVATKWAKQIGPEKVIEYARKMGVSSPLEPSIPLALGVSELSPLEMAVVAATLSSGGIRPKPIAVLKVVDSAGTTVLENRPQRIAVLDPGTCYIVTSLLRSVLGPGGTGEGLRAYLGNRPAAGKTGTTDGQKDAWFVGYTRELACAVWVGWDNRERSLPGTGGTVAGPIWADFIARALRNYPPRDWPLPNNVRWAEVCDDTGLLANPTCQRRHYEVFRKDAMPPIDTRNHLLDRLIPPKQSQVDGQDQVPLPVIRAEEWQNLPELDNSHDAPSSPDTPQVPPFPSIDELIRRLFPEKPQGPR